MVNVLKQIPKWMIEGVRKVGRAADKAGLPAFLVGGVVRDILLKRPLIDMDVVVEGDAVGFARTLAAGAKAGITVYKQFGTATLQFKDGLQLDLATARTERYVSPGALPVVRPGGIREDLGRRDFSVNALAVSLNARDFGRLIDESDGLDDLKQKKIRVLHALSFEDDPTRLLRAVRYEQRLGFKMEPGTLALFKQALINRCTQTVAPPRYFNEFRLMLEEPDPVKPLVRLRALGGLDTIDRDLKVDVRMLKRIQRNVTSLKQKSPDVDEALWPFMYFLSMAGTLKPASRERILRKYHFRKEESRALKECPWLQSLIRTLSAERMTRSRVRRCLESWPDHLVVYARVGSVNRKVCARIDRYLKTDRHVTLALKGRDLVKTGCPPGKRLGAVMDKLLDLKIDRKLSGRREELAAAKKLINSK